MQFLRLLARVKSAGATDSLRILDDEESAMRERSELGETARSVAPLPCDVGAFAIDK